MMNFINVGGFFILKMNPESFLERSRVVKSLIENDPLLLERLKEYQDLDVLSDSGGSHIIYRLCSIVHAGTEYHIAVRSLRNSEYYHRSKDIAQGDLEYCAQEYAKINDDPSDDRLAPRFAVGALFPQWPVLEHKLLLVEDLTCGGKRKIECEIPPNAVRIEGTVYHVDFDLIEISLETRAREYANNPVFFSEERVICLLPDS